MGLLLTYGVIRLPDLSYRDFLYNSHLRYLPSAILCILATAFRAGKAQGFDTMNNTLLPHLEALIFASEHSISEEELLNVLLISHTDSLSLKDIRSGLAALKEKYESEESALELAMISGGWTTRT